MLIPEYRRSVLAFLGSDAEAAENFARMVQLVPEFEQYISLMLRELHKRHERREAAEI